MVQIPSPSCRRWRTSTMLAGATDIAPGRSAYPDLGPDNAWRVLARRLWKTDWCIRLAPFNQSLVALHCRTIAEDLERNRIGSPQTIKAKDIEAWIAVRTDSDTVAAGYRIVFRHLLGGSRSARAHFIDAICRTSPRASRPPTSAARSARP